ncbi:hypothetical protein SY88_11545 [Clostridiales bacterium PH28_bin88]|nr:hypothetical protein SY88_11545 [Clostridiales bacterium PH28_bin88]
MLSAILPAVLSFVRVPLYSRWFTPQVYGEFTLVSTAAVLGSSLVLAVFQNALLRYYDAHRRVGSLRPFLASLAAGVVAAFGMVGITALVGSTLWPGAIQGLIPWAFALFVIGSLQGLLGQINRLEHQPGAFVAGRLIDPLWQLGCPMALLSLGLSSTPAIFTTAVLAGLSSVGVGAIWARRQVAWAKPWEASSPLLSRALRYGLPLIPLALVNWVMSSSDRYMIQWFLGPESTGIYAMGYALAWMPVSMMASSLLMVMVPSVWERVNARGAAEGMGLVRRFALVYLGLAIPGALGLAILAPRIVDVLLAPQYAPAVQVVGPVAFAAVFGGLYSFLVKPWELHEATVQLPAYVGIGAGLSVLLNLWMVRALGVAGPAWSAVVAHGAVALLLLFQAERRYRVFVGPSLQDIWTIGLPSALMVTVIWAMDRWLKQQGILALATIIAAGASVYLAAWLPFQGALRRWLGSSRARGQL